MASNLPRINPIHSLRTQLCAGAIALLGVTLVSISYLLIEHQKKLLKSELEKTIVFQGRNIALSSEKALLRPDPEFELFPLVKRISAGSKDITSLVITDSKGTIQGDTELQNLSKPVQVDLHEYRPMASDLLEQGELVFEDKRTYLFKMPIRSHGKVIGFVYMTYSKEGLINSIKRAITITLFCGVAAFALGIVLSLLLFRRISRPMDVMMKGVNSLAEGHLETRIELPTKNEFRILADSFNNMASSLFEAQRELVEKELMDRELEIAHDIQSTLIPHEISQPRGYEIEVYYKAAMQVGGDYVDVIPIDSTRIALAMADVSGKGIPGLVLMAMLKIMVHELARKGIEPVQVIRQLNVSLAKYVRRNMFVTMFFGILDTETGNIRCSNAGHNPIILYHHSLRSSGFHKMKGPPIGLFPDEYFCNQLREYRFKLEPGDVVLQYTDGLLESQDSGGNQFSLQKIISTCEVHGSSGAKALVELLVEAEQEFRGHCPQFDDLTLLAVGAPVTMSAEKALVKLNI